MKKLYQIAAKCCQDVYKTNTDIGTTEYSSSVENFHGIDIQILAIAGTNEVADWVKNVNLWSKHGIKKVAVDAAEEIRAKFGRIPELPLLVCGHSKAGPTAIAYKRLFNADWCIAFAPARSLRYWSDRKMDNTTIFIDPDDPVSKAGFINFGHPKCNTIKAEDDHFGMKIKDHFMGNWVEFVDNM